MRSVRIEGRRLERQFWLLAVTFALIFLLGGSSKPNVPSLMLLRPFSILIAGYGLATMRAEEWRRYQVVAMIAVAVLALTALHLVPLPQAIWSGLPGRQLIRDINALAIGGEWRPLSMVPEATRNALYALAIPIAVLALIVQQSQNGHVRVLIVLIVLAGLSGVVGLLQASGIGIQPSGAASEISGLFANRNHQGTMLALLLPMLGVSAAIRIRHHPRERWPFVVAGSLAGVTIVLIVVTGSRSGLALALVSSLMVPLILYGTLPIRDRRVTQGAKLRRLIIGIGLIGVLVGGLLLLTMFSSRDQAISRIGQVANDPRYGVWGVVINGLPRFLPWGTGIGSYADVYQTLEPLWSLRPTYSNHVHNELLEIAFTAGIPGLLIVLAVIVAFALGVRNSLSSTGLHALFSRLGLAMIALVALASITDYPARTPIIAAVLAVASIWASSSRRFGNDLVRKDV